MGLALAPLLLWSCNSLTGASDLTITDRAGALPPGESESEGDEGDDDRGEGGRDDSGPGGGDSDGEGDGDGDGDGVDRLACEEESDGAGACVQCCVGAPREDLAQRYFRNCFCGPFERADGAGIIGFCQDCATLCQTVGDITAADFARCLECGSAFNLDNCESVEALCRFEDGGSECDGLDDCIVSCN
ncbi:MAG TPA: hypothetical protein VFS00_08835 [Polyangiaceae bacterium]|nr:hypothetical protein [Polyangiaceae bacterium]